MRLGVSFAEVGELTIPQVTALLEEGNARRSRMLSKAKQQKAMGVIDFSGLW
ncbi:MAG: hypothetical protein Q8R01_10415 [Ramlibacter sp.]|nr:hypothetical protein [Ramlibacter sp.]